MFKWVLCNYFCKYSFFLQGVTIVAPVNRVCVLTIRRQLMSRLSYIPQIKPSALFRFHLMEIDDVSQILT